MKKIVIFLLTLVFFASCLSITISAETVQSDLVSQWFSSAIKYASFNDYDNFSNLYGDIDPEEIQKDFSFFRETVYKQKLKCRFYVVSNRESGQIIVDVMYHKQQNLGDGTIKNIWFTSVMCFGSYQDHVVRIPDNYFLCNDYDSSNNQTYRNGFSNNEAWVKHDSGTISRCTPTIRYAKRNTDGSISLVISIVNRHKYDAKAFCLYAYKDKSFVTFGQYKFNLTKYIDRQIIPAGKIKNYKITIPASKVPNTLSNNDITKCEFTLNYSYWAGDALYYGCLTSRFNS